jgi:hypothetical protein
MLKLSSPVFVPVPMENFTTFRGTMRTPRADDYDELAVRAAIRSIKEMKGN